MRNAGACRCRSSASTRGCPCSRAPARMPRRRRSISRRTSSWTGHRFRARTTRRPFRTRTRRRPFRAKTQSRPVRSMRAATTTSPPLPRTSPPRARTTPRRPSSVTRPTAVALTGGIAAGKSEALESFARHGAATASADAIVHELLASDEEVREAIRARWGDDAVGDRARIGAIVFEDPPELDWLEQLLHPRARRAQPGWLGGVPADLAVVEVPLLYETGGESRFDAVVVITAPPDVRLARRPAADGRENRLLPDEEKVRRADFSYVNDGTLEELDAFVAGVVESLTSS